MKKLLVSLLVLIAVCCEATAVSGHKICCDANVHYSDEYTIGDFRYFIDYHGSTYINNGVELHKPLAHISAYTGNAETVTMPSYIDGIEVSFLNFTFQDNETMIHATFPEELYYIPDGMCYGCTNLQSVSISFNDGIIPHAVFYECESLTDAPLSSAIRHINSWAFGKCKSLTHVTIPGYQDWNNPGVTTIGDYAFYDCSSLETVSIPDSLKEIGYAPFGCCESLKTIKISTNHPILKKIDGVLFSKDGKRLIWYPADSTQSEYSIPHGVKEIEDGVFYSRNNLVSVVIPNSVTNIDDFAFKYCNNLKSVSIPESVTNIGKAAFEGCESLTEIKIPNSVTSIGEWAFNWCFNAEKIIIPNSIKSISNYAFQDCDKVVSVTIPNSVTSIGEGAFGYCNSLTTITIPSSVTFIDETAFQNSYYLDYVIVQPNSYAEKYCKQHGMNYYYSYEEAEKVMLADSQIASLTDIYDLSFSYSENKDGSLSITGLHGSFFVLEIPSEAEWGIVTEIANNAFENSKVSSVLIPDTIKRIGDQAFQNSAVLAISLPFGVEEIGDEAFANCAKLQSIAIPSSVTSIGANAFDGCNQLQYLKVQLDSFAEAYCWKYDLEYTIYDEEEEKALAQARLKELYEVDDYCFYLTEENNIVIAKYIGDESELIIPNKILGCPVKAIENYAFHDCSTITSITIPRSVVQIGNDVFDNCDKLKTIYIQVNSYADIYFRENNLPYEIVAEMTSIEVTVKSNELYLRNEKGSAIELIKKGKTFYITDYNPDTGLFTAEYGNRTGYVTGKGLDISRDELLGYFK